MQSGGGKRGGRDYRSGIEEGARLCTHLGQAVGVFVDQFPGEFGRLIAADFTGRVFGAIHEFINGATEQNRALKQY